MNSCPIRALLGIRGDVEITAKEVKKWNTIVKWSKTTSFTIEDRLTDERRLM